MIRPTDATSSRWRPAPWVFAAVIAPMAMLAVVAAVRWYVTEVRMPLGDCAYLESLRPQEALADADAAIARGDHHLLGVHGYSMDVPGIDPAADRTPHTIQPIERTGDAWESRRHERLNQVAIVYADRYNRRVLQRVAVKR